MTNELKLIKKEYSTEEGSIDFELDFGVEEISISKYSDKVIQTYINLNFEEIKLLQEFLQENIF